MASEPLSKRARNGAGVVDADLLDLAGQGVLALLDERLGHGGDVVDAAVEPEGGVDAVGEQVAGHAAAGGLGVEPPQAGAALRQVGGDRPVLQEVGAVVEDAAELALVDELLGERHGGDAAVVVPDHVGHAGLLDGGDHLLRLRRRSSPAASRRGSSCRPWRRRWRSRVCRLFGVQMSTDVDVLARDQLPPVGLDRLDSPTGRRRPWPWRRRGRRRP